MESTLFVLLKQQLVFFSLTLAIQEQEDGLTINTMHRDYVFVGSSTVKLMNQNR